MSIIEYYFFKSDSKKLKKHFAKHISLSLPEVFFSVCNVSVYRVINNINSSFYVILSNKDSIFFIVKIHHRTINKKNRNMRGWWWACAHLAENKKKHFHIRERGSWTYEHNANSTSYMYMNEDELWLTPLRIEWVKHEN